MSRAPVDSMVVQLKARLRLRSRLTLRRGARRPLAAMAIATAVLTLAGCTAAAGDTHRPGSAAGANVRQLAPRKVLAKRPASFGVGYGLVNWDEKQGYTENFYTDTTSPGRLIKVEILYPTLAVKAPKVAVLAPPARRFGPFPVVVFAHGYDVDPVTYRAMLVSWAEAGYVVVAPFFPDTSTDAVAAQHGVDTEGDIFNQPADVAFVVSQVQKAAKGSPLTRVGYLDGVMNPGRLILAGQSDGAGTVAALMYDQAYAATRASLAVRPVGVALLSGGELLRKVDVYSPPKGGGPPVLVVQSLTDACNAPANSSLLYDMLQGSTKWFLALEDASHLGPYVGLGSSATVVEKTTVAFFNLVTGRTGARSAAITAAGTRTGVSTITTAASVPLYPAPAPQAGACSPPPGVPAG